jgi:hypothetical protein
MATQLSRMQLSLREWQMSNVSRAEERVSAYLPTEARLSLTVLVVLAPAFDTEEFDPNPENPRVFVSFTPSMLPRAPKHILESTSFCWLLPRKYRSGEQATAGPAVSPV